MNICVTHLDDEPVGNDTIRQHAVGDETIRNNHEWRIRCRVRVWRVAGCHYGWMPITPDTKNWTWVIDEPCGECGFDAGSFNAPDVAAMLRENAAAWPAVLARADVRVRPADSTWSPLEYAAHVRDVYRLFAERLKLMETSNDPLYPNWDQDATAVAERYNEQDPAEVSASLTEAASALAAAFDRVEDWTRTGRRSDGVQFTTETFAKYFIHDPVHHLHDVSR